MNRCVSDELLHRLLAEQLDATELDVCSTHVERCAICQQRLASMADVHEAFEGRRVKRKDPPELTPDSAFLQYLKHLQLPKLTEEQPGTAGAEAATTPQDAAAATVGPELWPSVAGYEILSELGRGGMGVVYKARQLGLNRLVALKMILAGAHADGAARARFRREAEAVARVQHPNIIQIHQVGEAGGCPFFSLELAESGTLAERLIYRRPTSRQAAAWVETLARAVHFAHQAGIVHRDLKPANVVLTAEGVLKITDFGLAKQLQGDATLTQTGDMMGTPSYMSPEQASGQVKEIGPLSDVYALGAILYESLTGKPPFRAASRLETLLLVREAEPTPPRSLNPGVDRGLETVCLKCLAKEPRRRYASAEALADDLKRWLAGDSIVARPEPWAFRAIRSARRPLTKKLIAMAALIAPLLVVGVIYFSTHGPTPEEIEAKRQADSLQILQNHLAGGQPVTLVGPKGWPSYFRWMTSDTVGKLFTADDGTFSMQHWEFGLLELLPDPQLERYRFRAEVRHAYFKDEEGAVGIYFGHSQLPAATGQMHCYCATAFDDLTDLTKLHPGRPQTGNPFRLAVQRHLSSGFTLYQQMNPEHFCFVPVAPMEGPGPWRTIEVWVTPERVQVFWQGQRAANASRQTLDDCAHRMATMPGDPLQQDPSLSPRGGLGLYVKEGAASFRSVEVEPLVGDN